MAIITLDYPVYSLDRQLLLPAGTILSEEDFQALVPSSSSHHQKKYPLMQFGTVRKDILDFVRQTPGNTVFSNDQELAETIELMETVQLAPPKLDSIEYFKQNDSYTYRHILMVFAYLTLLSKDLVPNYPARIREVATSPLHDFGKICVPLEILKKESPLTRDERKNLEHHTTAGYILLRYYSQNVDHLPARVARDHHERNNGSGYPRGIRLNDRMVEIVAVCDIYDALTSPRPYRPVSFDNRTALEHITMMAERNEVSWEVVQALVAHNRKEKPHFSDCSVSIKKRGVIPTNNVYGILAVEVIHEMRDKMKTKTVLIKELSALRQRVQELEQAESKHIRVEEALRESENRYLVLSILDNLTQLYNSRHFYNQLKNEIDRVNRYGQPLTLMLLDLDDFKAFNDAYGHVEGDQVLWRLAQVVKRCLRQTDSAYRYGGEEFTVLLPMTTTEDGTFTAERIRTELKKENFSPTPGQNVHVTVSIGLAEYSPKEEIKVFVHRVDQLMYQAKKNGKDRVCSDL